VNHWLSPVSVSICEINYRQQAIDLVWRLRQGSNLRPAA
jgi:hypothetical protein